MAGKPIPRDQVQLALRVMAVKAREAKDEWRRELAACQAKGLIKRNPYSVPASLTERFAHRSMAESMLHIAVCELLFNGRNTSRVDVYVRNLIAGERWPTETGTSGWPEQSQIQEKRS
jgi:hypothetical protein